MLRLAKGSANSFPARLTDDLVRALALEGMRDARRFVEGVCIIVPDESLVHFEEPSELYNR